MTARVIRHVDAFTSTPLEGNPAAVVDGEGLSTDVMQRIALNQKLSETVFLLPADDSGHHARLRIFTPAVELPFAGHPTLAAAHTLVSEGAVKLGDGESLLLETGAGLVPLAIADTDAGALYEMTQVAPAFRAAEEDPAAIAAAVGLSSGDIARMEWVSTGIYWLVAQVVSLEAMMRVQPDFTALAGIFGLSIFCTGAATPGVDVHVRAFAPAGGVPEDPVTGSANGCIGAFIAKHAVLPERDEEIRYVAEQGIEMGQPGRVYVRVTGGASEPRVHVGGYAVTVLRGELLLP